MGLLVRTSYWLKDWLMWLPSKPLPQNFSIYCSTIQDILPINYPNIPITNIFLSTQTSWVIIKKGKSISGTNYAWSAHMKWCNLKIMGNWSFSPRHTLSPKTVNILYTLVDQTKIKTHLYRKLRERLAKTISRVLVEKRIGMIIFPTPTPNMIIFHSMRMNLLIILQISDIFQPFFSMQYMVTLMTCKCYLMPMLCYLNFPRTNSWTYVSKKCSKKRVSLVWTDRWKYHLAVLELYPWISMNHRHSSN